MSIFNRLFDDRIIFLENHITDMGANELVAQMLYLEAENPRADIYMYINSPGGAVTAGFFILDVMRYIQCPVSTICGGQAASMSAVILSSGTRGKRLAFQNAEIMIHKVSAGYYGKEPDIKIQAERIEEMNANLIDILAENCGKPAKQLERDMDRDFFMSARQAKEYGLIDEVIQWKNG